MLVEVSSSSQSQFLSICNTIGSFSVKDDQTLHICHGIISESDLLLCTKEKILKNLKYQNVINVCWIAVCQNEQVLHMECIILAFNSPTLSSRFKVACLP